MVNGVRDEWIDEDCGNRASHGTDSLSSARVECAFGITKYIVDALFYGKYDLRQFSCRGL
jgi:hypothetical protein